MDIGKAIIQTLAFFDLFDQPLSAEEIRQFLWAEEKIGLNEIVDNLSSNQKVEAGKGFYFLSGRSDLVGKREDREWWQDRKMTIARRAARLLSLVPFVCLVAVCNTLGFAAAKEDSDIDFFIVARRGRLWYVRFCSAMLLSIFGLRRHGQNIRNKICLSFFVSDDNLDLRPIMLPGAPDVYLIYWIMNLVPLVNRQKTLEKFWQANLWIKNYVANWDFADRERDYRQLKTIPAVELIIGWKEKIWAGAAGDWLGTILKGLQLKKISGHKESRINLGGTAVIVNDQMLKFHEEDRREEYKRKWLEISGIK